MPQGVDMITDKAILNNWHIIGKSEDVRRGEIYAVHLLEQEGVLWRDNEGQVHFWDDRCPHRGASLTIGNIKEGELRCHYHGWRYDKDGQCTHIPAHPDLPIPKAACVKSYSVCERYGYVWGSYGKPERGVPTIEAFEEEDRLNLVLGPLSVNTSPGRMVENFLDMAHFPYVHGGYLGFEEAPTVADYKVESTAEGITAYDCTFAQPAASAGDKSAISDENELQQISYTYKTLLPYTALLIKRTEGRDKDEVMMLSASPVDETHINVYALWSQGYDENDRSPSYVEEVKKFTLDVIYQDVPTVESQKPKLLPLADLASEVPQRCDMGSIAYRKWLIEAGITYGTTLPAPDA